MRVLGVVYGGQSQDIVLVLPQVVIRRLEAEGAAARAAAADKVRPVCNARCWHAVPPTRCGPHPAPTLPQQLLS